MNLSIIVPVFRVKQYIRRCLESILSIKGMDYELIIVQDTKHDDSLDEISDLLKNPVIRICDQVNAGLSAARNFGLAHSQGDFIYFMDSDDYIDADAFSAMFRQMREERLDMFMGSFQYIDENNLLLEDRNEKIRLGASGSFLGKDYLIKHSSFPMVWMSIYSRDFLSRNDLSFKEGIYFEDVEFTPRALFLARKLRVTTAPFYYYRIRTDSLNQQVFGIKKLRDSIIVANSLLDFSDAYCGYDLPSRSYFEKRALATLWGTMGFYLQKSEISEDEYQRISVLFKRITMPHRLPLHFRISLLLNDISPRMMLYIIKKRYQYKYFTE